MIILYRQKLPKKIKSFEVLKIKINSLGDLYSNKKNRIKKKIGTEKDK